MCLTTCQRPTVRAVTPAVRLEVYDEPRPHCCAGVRTSRLTVLGETLGIVTTRAHRTVALPPCQDSEALHGLSCGKQKGLHSVRGVGLWSCRLRGSHNSGRYEYCDRGQYEIKSSRSPLGCPYHVPIYLCLLPFVSLSSKLQTALGT